MKNKSALLAASLLAASFIEMGEYSKAASEAIQELGDLEYKSSMPSPRIKKQPKDRKRDKRKRRMVKKSRSNNHRI